MADPSDTFYQTLELSLNEPVGCLSMSPENRDVVLGARKGLFVIDLNHPYQPPRFLAHSATWDVADIQWSPHPERRSWVASTSSQKALIWNLDLPYHSQSAYVSPSSFNMSGDPTLNPDQTVQSPIEFVLEAHTRAICDINWSVFNIDVLATCGIDSWTYAFDLRSGSRAVQGFCAWNSPATQVKWNRQNCYLLASSHDSRVLVWDTRRPGIPLLEIKAHDEKIYGVDWSRRSADGIVTCSLDKTVKFWSTTNPQAPFQTIHTPSPVRRARHLPFGHGVMTLPQRSDHILRMWRQSCPNNPIAVFSGHRDTVREFVWRTRGGENAAVDDRQFQLVTWGNDRKLRLWPITQDVLDKAGFRLGSPIDVRVTRKGTTNRSFRHSSLTVPFVPSPPSMSVSPFRISKSHQSSSPSSVAATLPSHSATMRNRAVTLSEGVKASNRRKSKLAGTRPHVRHPGFMTRQSTMGVEDACSHRLTWMEGVKLYRPSACADNEGDHLRVSTSANHTRSLSRDSRYYAADDVPPDACHQPPLTLGEELTAAQRNLPRVTFEQLTVQARKCSVGLYGPWAVREGIAFIRANFTFPKTYPHLKPPSIEIERSSDVTARTRAYLLKSVRELMQEYVRKREPGSLEACLKFLLGDRSLIETEKVERYVDSEEEMRDIVIGIRPDILQNNVNVPSPRQGGVCFSPRGQLIRFYCGDSWASRGNAAVPSAKRNYKFEAFGTLALSPSDRPNRSEDEESESDEALRLPTSRRLSLKPNPTCVPTNCAPHRELSTVVIIQPIEILQPAPIPALESLDAKGIVESAKSQACFFDPGRYFIWATMGLFLQGSQGLRDCEISTSNSKLLFDLIEHLKFIQDIETLGYIACVIEMNRREHDVVGGGNERERRTGQATTPTDYFNSRRVNKARAEIPSSGSNQSLDTLEPTSGGIESTSQSPSKGSWSQFFLSLTQSTGRSAVNTFHQAPSVVQSKSQTTPTPSSDKAVAKLKQQLGVSPSGPVIDPISRRESKVRTDSTSGHHERHVSFQQTAGLALKPDMNHQRRKRVYRVIDMKIGGPKPSDTLADPILQNELEGYRYVLCDLLLRRERLEERGAVVKMLRSGDAAKEEILQARGGHTFARIEGKPNNTISQNIGMAGGARCKSGLRSGSLGVGRSTGKRI